MSCLVANNGVFLHVPKTGGMFFRRLAVAINIYRLDFGSAHANMERTLHNFKYYPLNALRTSLVLQKNIDRVARNSFKFCFVRSPYGWYESYWRFMQKHNWNDFAGYTNKGRFGIPHDQWNPLNELLQYGNSDFNRFMENVLTKQPGFVTGLYEGYATPGHINYVGHFETLLQDIKQILTHLKINYSEAVFSELGKINASETPRPVWDTQIKQQVYNVEKEAFEKYGYNQQGLITNTGAKHILH